MSEHRIEIVSDFMNPGWTAMCSCGWKGVNQDTPSAASYDGHSHAVFEEFRLASKDPAGEDRGHGT